MMDEAQRVRLVCNFTVIRDEIALEPGVNRLALRQLAVKEEASPILTNPDERFHPAFDSAKAGGDGLLIEGSGDIVGDLTVEVADAIRSGEAEDRAIFEGKPSTCEGRAGNHGQKEGLMSGAQAFSSSS
jgi:hypothetical protein